MFLTWILFSLNRDLLLCQDPPCVVAFSNSFCILASWGWSMSFSSEVFWLERERIANVLCLVHIFFWCLYSSRVTHSLNLVYFSLRFYSFAPLSVGPGEMSAVPPTHQAKRATKQASQPWWRWGKPAVFQVWWSRGFPFREDKTNEGIWFFNYWLFSSVHSSFSTM